ncbi:hypothetical protein K493DRAFT_390240 [Basidiobolus meristosporus CBS 931.73]|uniref:BAG domain-containing protein n=1 Tax=Basidiobolus meristosporus CBS 931.73 TaxID=1314790 RepID=A0A1Y1X303_9FUNG|nr:hypothetical protein K493DRAFT_390240 [Basidiobolus meristosporus CBS 931.73]|eukprot:ORX80190.1 hypothetical protein K493DRAFT_390240 [Basidiobolus meristosporus CBS 931.73]
MYPPYTEFYPYEAVCQIPTQRRRVLEPVYYAPSISTSRRYVHPENYIEYVSHPRYYHTSSPSERYFTQSSRYPRAFEPDVGRSYIHPSHIDRAASFTPVINQIRLQPARESSQYKLLRPNNGALPLDYMRQSLPPPEASYGNPRRIHGQRLNNSVLDMHHLEYHPEYRVSARDSLNNHAARYSAQPWLQNALLQQEQHTLMMENQKKRLEEERRIRAIHLFILNRATKTIQRQWRLYCGRRRVKAAETIVNFIISQREIHQARKIKSSLRQLRDYGKEVEKIHDSQIPRVFEHPLKFDCSAGSAQQVPPIKENQIFLGCEEALLKMLVRIDGVESMDCMIIREVRKSLVQKVQSFLDKLDNYKVIQYEEYLQKQIKQVA